VALIGLAGPAAACPLSGRKADVVVTRLDQAAADIGRLLAGYRKDSHRWMFNAQIAWHAGGTFNGKLVGQIDRRMCLTSAPKSSAFSDMLRIWF
jgi:hypothetical protein